MGVSVESGLLILVFCWAGRAGGCNLGKKSTIARNKEPGCAESRQPGVSGDKKKSFQKGCQRLLQFRKLLTSLKPNPGSKDCLAQTQ